MLLNKRSVTKIISIDTLINYAFTTLVNNFIIKIVRWRINLNLICIYKDIDY